MKYFYKSLRFSALRLLFFLPKLAKEKFTRLKNNTFFWYKYGTNQTGFTDFPQSQRRIKLITETHFTWVQFDTATKKVSGTAGGTYSLNENTYTESIDFGLAMDTYLGQKHAFTIRVEGEKFSLSGSLADGLKIEEVWQRAK
jgi:hypothetical protein